MAGELWRGAFQIGKETTAGTTVAATRKMYFGPDSRLARERAARPHKFATASRDNVRALTLGSTEISGTVTMPLSASELIELLLMSIRADVAGVLQTAAYLWTFTPGTSLNAATLEWDDGARVWEAGGCYVNSLKFSGNVREGATVEAEIFGMNLAATTLTAALSDRTPDFIEGWETKMFVDNLGATPGTTQVTGTLINWEVEINNQLGRKYFAENTQDVGSITTGELEIKAKLMFEASNAAALTEFNNWDGVTERLVRLDFGNNEQIAGSEYKYVKLDIPGAWDAFDLGGSDEGTRTYDLGLQYIYDSTNAFGLQILAMNARSAAWA
ncbi:MAG: hypothetical protein GY805_05020 [Chloroflexi bacterium]|nr:hypothetical protein [Chloroflexota bacterium]